MNKKIEDFEKIAFYSWKEHLLRNRSIIVDLMQGQLRSRLKCLECGNESVKFDSFMFLSVPLPKKRRGQTISLDDCLAEFSRIEILEGEDMWQCTRCKSPQRTEKTIDIWKLPTVLICVVKRFYFSKQKRQKLVDLVDFPVSKLELTRFVSSPQKQTPLYDLFGVVNHEGSMSKGHYYAFTKHRNNNQWYYYDDEEVRVIKDVNLIVSGDAYILFYGRTTEDEIFRQTLGLPSVWPHVIDEDLFDPGKNDSEVSYNV